MTEEKLLDLARNAIKYRPYSNNLIRALCCFDGRVEILGCCQLPKESILIARLTEDECKRELSLGKLGVITAKLQQLDIGGFICQNQ